MFVCVFTHADRHTHTSLSSGSAEVHLFYFWLLFSIHSACSLSLVVYTKDFSNRCTCGRDGRVRFTGGTVYCSGATCYKYVHHFVVLTGALWRKWADSPVPRLLLGALFVHLGKNGALRMKTLSYFLLFSVVFFSYFCFRSSYLRAAAVAET